MICFALGWSQFCQARILIEFIFDSDRHGGRSSKAGERVGRFAVFAADARHQGRDSSNFVRRRHRHGSKIRSLCLDRR